MTDAERLKFIQLGHDAQNRGNYAQCDVCFLLAQLDALQQRYDIDVVREQRKADEWSARIKDAAEVALKLQQHLDAWRAAASALGWLDTGHDDGPAWMTGQIEGLARQRDEARACLNDATEENREYERIHGELIAERDGLRRALDALMQGGTDAALVWPTRVEKEKTYERFEDMSPRGRLTVLVQQDGDVILSIIPDPDEPRHYVASVEFCESACGAGQSSRVRYALLKLAEAIILDNEEKSQERRRANTEGDAHGE